MEYLAYSLMNSASAQATADRKFRFYKYQCIQNYQKTFKFAWLSFALLSTLLGSLAQTGVASAAYSGPGTYYVATNGGCLKVRVGPGSQYPLAGCYPNGVRLPQVVGYRNGFAQLSTGRYVSADFIDTQPSREDAPTNGSGVGGGVVLTRGSQGAAVSKLQRALGVKATGYYGYLTETAVRNFQARRGFPVTGVVDARTRRALGL